MMIHVSRGMLKKARFSVKRVEGKLNISGYDREELEKKVCPNCLLKSFKKNDTILIEDVESGLCECVLKLSPIVSVKLDINKNKKVMIV